jgi:hypothetical protein
MTAEHPSPVRLIVIGGIAAIWLMLSGLALYALQTADQRLFDPSILADNDRFSAHLLQQAFAALTPGATQAQLFFIVDPTCSCSEATIEHLQTLATELNERRVEVTLILPRESAQAGQSLAEALRSDHGIEVRLTNPESVNALIPSSPAAVLLNADLDLIYYGPWSAGAACVSGTSGFVESALKVLGDESPLAVINRSAVGCYCDWHSFESVTMNLDLATQKTGVKNGSA